MNKNNMEKLLEKRMSLFGDSGLFLFKDSTFEAQADWSKYYNISTALKFNETQPFALCFTPNGNLGKANHI
jgi:hypothetical protein